MILVASVTFTVGSVVMGFAGGKEALLAGRIIVGIGIGKPLETLPLDRQASLFQPAKKHLRSPAAPVTR